MPIDKVGIDFGNLRDMQPPSFNFSNNTKDFLNDLPKKTNELTDGIWAIWVLGVLFAYLYWRLVETRIYSDFNYSHFRGIGIASGICGVIGMFMTSLGYFIILYPTIFFIVICLLMIVAIKMDER